MLTIDALKAFGVNVDEGLARCMNNEAFYLKLVKMAVEDGCFDRLAQAVDSQNKQEAFAAAHDLKGVLGNLSITPLYSLVSQITELLRAGEDVDYPSQVAALMEQRNKLKALC